LQPAHVPERCCRKRQARDQERRASQRYVSGKKREDAGRGKYRDHISKRSIDRDGAFDADQRAKESADHKRTVELNKLRRSTHQPDAKPRDPGP
jgi:hypothetical protein